MPITGEVTRIMEGAINHTELNHNKFIVPELGWSSDRGWWGVWNQDMTTHGDSRTQDNQIPCSRVPIEDLSTSD